MEIADILVVNKADRPGVEHTETALKNMLQLAHPQMKRHFVNNHHDYLREKTDSEWIMWETQVLKTIAKDGEGLPELMVKLAEHRNYLLESGELEYKLKNQISFELNYKLKSEMLKRFNNKIDDKIYQETFNRVIKRDISPQEAVEKLLE